jgi:hypothetical protein
MRHVWAYWLAGTLLAITAFMLVASILIASASAVPPLPWTFYAIYGTVAVVLSIAAALFLRRGGVLLHQESIIGLKNGHGDESRGPVA